ncbi:hypothetical protein [Archangium lipolyticum]|uniref:hypothetical protein n=1 Tax=Archangium lipolyticum TaxID=2970465 RepID=UPI002149D18B|nr:hypothetical protein [Archangium lipolyticum]
MTKNTVMGLLSLLSLTGVGFAQTAQAAPACETYCKRGVCGSCDDYGYITTCYVYNGCGGKYPIPYRAQPVSAFFAQAKTGCDSAPAPLAQPSSLASRYLKASPAPSWLSTK